MIVGLGLFSSATCCLVVRIEGWGALSPGLGTEGEVGFVGDEGENQELISCWKVIFLLALRRCWTCFGVGVGELGSGGIVEY